MKQTKPDRWERVVEDFEFIRDCGGKETPVCESYAVLNLLRKEHAAVVRMVKNTAQDYESSVGDTAAEMLRDEILAKLKRRAQ